MVGSRDNPEGDGPWLELSVTRLRVVGGELIRLNARGTPVLRLPLKSITSVSATAAFEPLSALFLVAALGAAALGRFVSESNLLTVALYLGATAGVLLAVFGCVRHQLVFAVTGLPPVAVACQDQVDEVAGFAASLTTELAARRADAGP